MSSSAVLERPAGVVTDEEWVIYEAVETEPASEVTLFSALWEEPSQSDAQLLAAVRSTYQPLAARLPEQRFTGNAEDILRELESFESSISEADDLLS